MRIEKISDTQIKFILTKTDLSERDIQFGELEYGSAKTQELFYEMMEQASIEYGFLSENTPLMIEAIPITLESIMIIVTKVSNIKDIDQNLRIFKDNEEKLLNSIRNVGKLKNTFSDVPKISKNKNNILIYYFNSLDDIITVSKKIVGIFNGESSVYKYNKMYFLVLESKYTQKSNYILSEYGQKHISNTKNKYHLMEHGEIITEKNAVENFSTM
ncbi:MAG: adaptor protein MecA [Defluviitaleaceae bacterium]|nr:adaptor protein MecA [Defluviitaleaceae bacterium]